MNYKPRSIIFMVMFSLLASTITLAQKQKLIGLTLYTNLYPDEIRKAKMKFGATYEMQLRKHSGGETGMFFRSERSSITVPSGSGTHTFRVVLRYLSVPVLYKYYSRHINFSAGPAFDVYVGWKQTDEGTGQIQSYKVGRKVRIGSLTKVSKVFPVNTKIIIEPEIRFGSVRFINNPSIGIGVSGKYRL